MIRSQIRSQIRIGNGFDVHRFSEDAQRDATLTLAGIALPHTHQLIAHSDGDVVCHALCDAMLGALALGDIGMHFPDTDPQYQDISSLVLLREVHNMIKTKNWQLGNADITIIAEQPKISPYQAQMRQSLADTLGLAIDTISIKATTTEKLGFTGRGEGIAVQATVLLFQDAS